MKKDVLIILALLIFAVMGIYVSCTGTETDITIEKNVKKAALITPISDTVIS